MTTLDEYTLHTNAQSATIDRWGFLGDELKIRIFARTCVPRAWSKSVWM